MPNLGKKLLQKNSEPLTKDAVLRLQGGKLLQKNSEPLTKDAVLRLQGGKNASEK